MKVWVLSLSSCRDCDRFVVKCFSNKPTDDQIKEIEQDRKYYLSCNSVRIIELEIDGEAKLYEEK